MHVERYERGTLSGNCQLDGYMTWDGRQLTTRWDTEPSGPSSDPAPNPTPNPNNLIHSTIHHRLGPVPVGSPSIVIAVSSPHRQSAFRACEFILEQVKSRAQIWKREFYDCDGVDDCEADAIWKDNRS